ncbi:hypothetical protein ACFSQT_19660 [Mesorhizobium calcicola]|uniref:Uncharacterized protein n=1 Tax=Mesorhizobium calcicola TaxID=1300310 RepID=A0ABW4WIA4_9HYPH
MHWMASFLASNPDSAQAGGNLSAALASFARASRSQEDDKAKVQALSMEAKRPPPSLGALPFIVRLVYLSSQAT